MTPIATHQSPFIECLTFAHQLADVAGEIIRPYFGAHGTVEHKSDESPVTIADREAEAAMRALIETHYPAHSIYGEEFGLQLAESAVVPAALPAEMVHSTPTTAMAPSPLAGEGGDEGAALAADDSTTHHPPLTTHHYTWVIDPIDGTRAFIAGRKEWGTLIALCENGIPIIGILDQPVTGERWVGVRGQATKYSVITSASEAIQLGHTNTDGLPRRCAPRHDVTVKTRPCASISDAELSTTSTAYFTPTQAAKVIKLAQSARATVKDGDCYAYGLLARGLRDVVVDAGLKPYDILALVPIIEGAGGKITGWDGSAITLDNFREVVAVGDKSLHSHTVALLQSA